MSRRSPPAITRPPSIRDEFKVNESSDESHPRHEHDGGSARLALELVLVQLELQVQASARLDLELVLVQLELQVSVELHVSVKQQRMCWMSMQSWKPARCT